MDHFQHFGDPYCNSPSSSFLPEGGSIHLWDIEETGRWDIEETDYQPFSHIQHASPLASAELIFRDGIKKFSISGRGVASRSGAPNHPAQGMEVVWFGPSFPGPPSEIGPALGNVTFNLPVSRLSETALPHNR